jgi:cytochrome c oxidase subunit 2
MNRFRSTGAKVAIFGSLAIFVVLWVGMIVAAVSGGDDPFQLTTLDPQGPFSTLIDNLVAPVFIIAGLVFVGVLGAVMFIVVKYREKGDPELDTAPMPKQTHGHTAAEITWTAIPAAILAVVAVLTAITILDLAAEEPDSLQVEVFGQQWWWGYRYDVDSDGRFDSEADVETATELVIPVGRPVQLSVTSNDVIHSFWIPALNGKRDAVPGMVSPWKLQADQPGVYRGQCTEFCGLSHANMRMLVRAIPADEYDRWVANQQKPAAAPVTELAQQGLAEWKNNCASCHLIDGVNNEQLAENPAALVAGIAPDLTHLMSRGTFAGSIYNLHYPNPAGNNQPFGATCTFDDLGNCGDPADVGLAGNPDNPVYRPALEAWLRNAPAMKPMAPDEGRGMPNLGLTQTQIDAIVAYLETLK